MPIVVFYLNGDRDIVEGESWRKLNADSPHMGTINLRSIDGQQRIIVNKSAVVKIVEITQAEWDARAEEEKRRAEKQKQDQAAHAAAAAREAKKFRNRVRRFLGKKSRGAHA